MGARRIRSCARAEAEHRLRLDALRPKQAVMFPAPPKPRRVMMRVCDAGTAEDGEHMVRYQCTKCGRDGGWWKVRTVTEGKRGIPCPRCNEPV